MSPEPLGTLHPPAGLAPGVAAAIEAIAGASGAWCPSLSPDGTRVAYVCDRSGLHTVLADGSGRALLAGAGRFETVFAGAWTSDGRYACSIADGIGPGTRVVVVDAEIGAVQPVPSADRLGFSVVTAVSPDGTELIVRSGPRNRRRLFVVPID